MPKANRTGKPARPLRPARKPKKSVRDTLANKQSRLHVKKGDVVRVLSGKDKDKEGRVLSVSKKAMRAVVEGVNIVKKHQKPDAQHQRGGIIEREASVHVSNLKVIDSAGV